MFVLCMMPKGEAPLPFVHQPHGVPLHSCNAPSQENSSIHLQREREREGENNLIVKIIHENGEK